MIIFSTEPYTYLQQQVLALNSKFIKGEMLIKHFPDGEIYHRILTEVKNQDVTIIGGTVSDEATLELYDIADGCVQNGANSITLVIPYFGYSTMERVVLKGEIVKARNRALLFSAIPTAKVATKILLFDLHSEGIPYYFDSNVQTQHIYCKKIILEAAKKMGGEHFVLAATDAGRAKWVESLAEELNVEAAFVYKNRSSGSDTNITGVNANVQDKIVIIYDDMIRTGGSLMQAALQYKLKGASQIFVITTHGLFNNDALNKIQEQGIIEKIICTDSHCNAVKNIHSLLEIYSIDSLIIENLDVAN